MRSNVSWAAVGSKVAVVALTLPALFFGWLLVGVIPGVPSMVDVFGIPGLRWPAGAAVLGLLTAAFSSLEI